MGIKKHNAAIKYIGVFLLTASVLLTNFYAVRAEDTGTVGTSAQAAAVIEQNSGRVLYNKNADQELPMASTTKIMTAAVALKYGNLSDVIEVSATAAGVEGSSMYLECGEKITLENLLYGLMLLSGNDAAVAIAEHIGGGVDGFVELMNKTASELGLSHTHFDNPNGLPSDTHYTTALELAKITRYAMSMPEFVQIVSTKSKTIPWEGKGYDRSMTNHNKLLGSLEGCIGVKTGFTKAAGRCLVSAVNRNDMTLICVTLNDPNDWADHASLQNSMFQKYSQNVLTSTEMIIDKISVAGGMLGYAGVSPNKTYTFPVCENDSVSVDTNVDSENMKFPIKSGDVVGTGTVTVNGENYGNFELLANSDIDLARPTMRRHFGQIIKMMKIKIITMKNKITAIIMNSKIRIIKIIKVKVPM